MLISKMTGETRFNLIFYMHGLCRKVQKCHLCNDIPVNIQRRAYCYMLIPNINIALNKINKIQIKYITVY